MNVVCWPLYAFCAVFIFVIINIQGYTAALLAFKKVNKIRVSGVMDKKVFRAVTTALRKYVVVTTVVSAVASQLAILRPPLAKFSHQLVF